MTKENPAQAKGSSKQPETPAAGPHAKPELTNEDATPGTGSLPSTKEKSDDVDGGTG